MMNRVFLAASFIPRASLKRLSTAQITRGKSDLSSLKKLQAKYQANEDIPVYLKGGTKDTVLYFTTLALLAISLAGAGQSLYTFATKK